MKVWLVGSKGMLGRHVASALAAERVGNVQSDREVDITEPFTVRGFLHEHKPSWVINCAAYTEVDAAEDDEPTARKLNADGPEVLARECRLLGCHLIHISTDYVFDGTLDRPYRENDKPNPLGVYGRTKLDGEQRVRSELTEHLIVRTAWLYGDTGNNFVDTMIRLMRERQSVSVVNDQIGSPTYAEDLARALVSLVVAPAHAFGTYHYVGRGECSWYDFAQEISSQGQRLRIIDDSCAISPVSSEQFPRKAVRPANSRLNTDKIRLGYGISPQNWQQSLAAYLSKREQHESTT